MVDNGLIEGVRVSRTLGANGIGVKDLDVSITLRGLFYLEENSAMHLPPLYNRY